MNQPSVIFLGRQGGVLIVTAIFVALIFISFFVGGGVVYFLQRRLFKTSNSAAKAAAQQMLERTETRCNQLLLNAKQKAVDIGVDIDNIKNSYGKVRAQQQSVKNSERVLRKREHGLQATEKKLQIKSAELNSKSTKLDNRARSFENELREKRERFEQDLQNEKNELLASKQSYIRGLAEISGLTEKEAKDKVLVEAEEVMRGEIAQRYRRTEKEIRAKAEDQAKHILAHSIQRMASDVVWDMSVTSIKLPDEEMKGRLIGREGRNVKALEAATGVNLIINGENPDEIVLSSFDPLRREVARASVEKLLRDGRIQPERIERTVQKIETELDKEVRKVGEEAVAAVGIRSLPSDLVEIMGKLKYRSSYGSNVLQHSIEVGLLAASIAAEVGADATSCRMAGFLHDIGKAFTPEVDKPHAEIGADLVKDYRFSKVIETAIREHHDSEMSTTESFIIAAADAVSAARPGVRNDNTAKFIKRMEELEGLVKEFKGVEKCFAMQSGHEVRVMVNPNGVSDKETPLLARDIAKRIGDKLKFPGEIRVQVIRELRAEAVAS